MDSVASNTPVFTKNTSIEEHNYCVSFAIRQVKIQRWVHQCQEHHHGGLARISVETAYRRTTSLQSSTRCESAECLPKMNVGGVGGGWPLPPPHKTKPQWNTITADKKRKNTPQETHPLFTFLTSLLLESATRTLGVSAEHAALKICFPITGMRTKK